MKNKQAINLYNKNYRSENNKKKGGLLCPYCNYYAVSLGNHIYKSHGITAKEYREIIGIDRRGRLTADCYHNQKSIQSTEAMTDDKKNKLREVGKHTAEWRRGKTQYKSKESLDRMIATGHKYKKLLELGRCTESALKAVATKKKNGYQWPKHSENKNTLKKIKKSLLIHHFNKKLKEIEST